MNKSGKAKEPLCGFCHNGRDAEDVCGTLYTSAECAAHKKCMQYSALLVQYRTKGFGGFKKHKVVDEIKRGRGLPCTICKSKPRGKKKPPKGATCGCAISSCRRTFHYYCAHREGNAVCRRIEVLNKTTSQSHVLYRIFCGPEHQAKFEKTQHEEDMEIHYNSDSSGTEYSDTEDDDEEVSQKVKKTMKETKDNPDSTSKPNNTEKEKAKKEKSGGNRLKRDHDEQMEKTNKKSKPDEANQKSKPDEANTKSKPDKANKMCKPGEANKKSKPDESHKKSKSDDADETFIFGDQHSNDIEENINSTDADEDNMCRTERLPSPNATPTKPTPPLARPGADIVLCFMEDGKHLAKYAERIKRMVAAQYGLSGNEVHFWSSPGPNQISPDHMLYYMRDVAKAVYDSDTDTLARLIVRPIQADMEKYTRHIQFHDDFMDPELHTIVQSRIRDVIGNYLQQKSKDLGIEVGGGFILAELDTIFLALPLGDLLDPQQEIRRRLPARELVFPLKLSVRLEDPRRQRSLSSKDRQLNMDKEITALTLWLQREADEPIKVRVRPKEVILRESTTMSTTCHMCNHFQRRNGNCSAAAPTSVAMFIVPVNGQVMAYATYCRLAIGSFVKEELTALSPIYAILDVDDLEGFSRVEDILPPMPDNITVCAYSGLDPADTAISCVALKFMLKNI